MLDENEIRARAGHARTGLLALAVRWRLGMDRFEACLAEAAGRTQHQGSDRSRSCLAPPRPATG